MVDSLGTLSTIQTKRISSSIKFKTIWLQNIDYNVSPLLILTLFEATLEVYNTKNIRSNLV